MKPPSWYQSVAVLFSCTGFERSSRYSKMFAPGQELGSQRRLDLSSPTEPRRLWNTITSVGGPTLILMPCAQASLAPALEEGPQILTARGMTQFAERLRFDLANTFSSD